MRISVTLLSGFFALLAGNGDVSAKPPQKRATMEFVVQNRASLGSAEVAILDARATKPERHPVTDMLIILAKPGGDVRAALTQTETAAANPDEAGAHFRLLVVAGGRLYAEARAQCKGWQNDVSQCSLDCEGGNFALRRNAGSPLELLVGAVPGGVGQNNERGVLISGCEFDGNAEVRLTPKSGHGLAVIGLVAD